MRIFPGLTTMAAVLSLASAPLAQIPAETTVHVTIGPKLMAKSDDLGLQELNDLSRELRDEVQKAVARSRTDRPVSVDLVLEDAVPNRPTFQQLSRTVSLSLRSIGLGGARISGVATYADGQTRPIKEQFYETDLREVRGYATWTDADRAFGQVAYDLGHGRLPTQFAGPGPSRSGHFGYPFSEQ